MQTNSTDAKRALAERVMGKNVALNRVVSDSTTTGLSSTFMFERSSVDTRSSTISSPSCRPSQMRRRLTVRGGLDVSDRRKLNSGKCGELESEIVILALLASIFLPCDSQKLRRENRR